MTGDCVDDFNAFLGAWRRYFRSKLLQSISALHKQTNHIIFCSSHSNITFKNQTKVKNIHVETYQNAALRHLWWCNRVMH
jgi:hypothetical protein